MRPSMMVRWQGSAGVQLNLRRAHSVFYKENVLRAPIEHVQAALLVPLGREILPRVCIMKKFHRHIAEGCIAEVAGDVGKIAGSKTGLAVLQLEGGGRLTGNIVFEVSAAQGDKHVVVTMAMHQGSFMGRDLYLERTDVIILEGKM